MEEKQDLLLSVADLSGCLGVTSGTLERWIAQGKLPCSLKDGRFMFRRSELEKWAARHKITLNVSAAGNAPGKDANGTSLADAVRAGGVYTGIRGDGPEEVLAACVKKLPTIPEDFKADLLERLVERETAVSTGVGNGVALPHPREPLAYLSAPMVPVFIPEEPVHYNAIDNKPVSVFCLVLAPTLRIHLTLLSSLSFCLMDKSFHALLMSGPGLEHLVSEINVRDTCGQK